MQPGELFRIDYYNWDVHETTIMRARVEFSVDAEIAIWRAEVPGKFPAFDDSQLAERLVMRGRATIVNLLALDISSNDSDYGPSTMTPEADAREKEAKS